MSSFYEGTLLAGRYVLVRRLGSGGMGKLWLAEDRRAESSVALKFPVDPAGASSGELLRKEWRIGSRLMHANIIRVFEFHDEADTAFYAMQYIGGPDIGVLTVAPVDDILRPLGLIADSLRYAHAKAIVHRDLKASNILLDERGIPYLLDFGVAASVGQVTAGGGSRISASPQQIAGEPAAASDDIYALGALMMELLTGRPPAQETTEEAVPLLDGAGEPLPSALLDLIRDMRNEDPAARPDAEAVRDRLQRAGFAAGPAATRLLGGAATEIELDKAEIIRPFEHKAPAATPAQGKDSGMSPQLLYGGLAALLVIFLGVVFLLPAAINDESQPGPTTEATLAADAAPSEAAVADAPGGRDSSIGAGAPLTESRQDSEDLDSNAAALAKAAADEALGELLSQLGRLQSRAIDRWGGQPYLDVLAIYAEGDKAYINRNYPRAGERYRTVIDRMDALFERVEIEFDSAFAAARDAFDNRDHINALKFFDLAAAISPGNSEAATGLARAKNLKTILDLMVQAMQFEVDLELDAARVALEKVLSLDPVWGPAIDGLRRVRAAIMQFAFEQRMTEGFDALGAGDYASARAAFNAAKKLDPQSRQPVDGLLQVDQEIRLASIGRLEREARRLEQNEEWQAAIAVYEKVFKIDSDLQFAQEGLSRSRQRAKLHDTLTGFIDDPDSLSAPVTMQRATSLLIDLSRISPMGPRLEDQKNALSRLLKRAATPLDVMLISDNQTDVAIFRIAKLGAFESRALSLRPGVYVAVGSRPGYRDVRIEFRVAPEIEMQPVVVQCEEQI